MASGDRDKVNDAGSDGIARHTIKGGTLILGKGDSAHGFDGFQTDGSIGGAA